MSALALSKLHQMGHTVQGSDVEKYYYKCGLNSREFKFIHLMRKFEGDKILIAECFPSR